MPTATEFDQAKVRYSSASSTAEQLIVPVVAVNGPEVLRGGRLAESIDRFVEVTDLEFRAVADELDDLAATSAQRAEECRRADDVVRRFVADYQAFEAAVLRGEVVNEPESPPRPPGYVNIEPEVVRLLFTNRGAAEHLVGAWTRTPFAIEANLGPSPSAANGGGPPRSAATLVRGATAPSASIG